MRHSSCSIRYGSAADADGQPVRRDPGALRESFEVAAGDHHDVFVLADVGTELVDRLAQLAHDVADDDAQLGDLGVLLARDAVHALELEGDVGERLRDAVVELAGDAGPFGFGAEGAQAPEPAGVVDGECEQARQALDEVAAARGRTRSGATSSSAISPTTAPRARSAVYMPLRASAAKPPSSGWTRRSSMRIGCGAGERPLERLRQVDVAHVRREAARLRRARRSTPIARRRARAPRAR